MACETHAATLGILCVGNALHGDDGLGEAVFDAMREQALPEAIRLLRLPFVGADALAHVEACERLLIVDALQGFGPPGSVHVLDPADVAGENARVSHGAGLGEWLSSLPAWFDTVPDIEIIGVEVQAMTPFSPGLSAPVRAAVPSVCARLRERIGHG